MAKSRAQEQNANNAASDKRFMDGSPKNLATETQRAQRNHKGSTQSSRCAFVSFVPLWLIFPQDASAKLASHKTPHDNAPMLSNEQAWRRLPGAPEAVQPLPAWARLLAELLPLTTARMLELDALHRTGSRLDPRLRGLVRCAAADADGCDYAR